MWVAITGTPPIERSFRVIKNSSPISCSSESEDDELYAELYPSRPSYVSYSSISEGKPQNNHKRRNFILTIHQHRT